MRRRDRGFVLVNALILVAAISALSVAVVRDTGDSLDRLAAAQSSGQADLYLDAAATLAGKLLRDDAALSEVDHLGEAWSLERYRATIDRGETEVSVRDLQGRFNLNLLLRPDPRAEIGVFLALAEEIQLDPSVTAAIMGYYDAERSAGASQARRRGPIYANAELAAVAELPGVRGDDLEALLPAVTLLPQESPVNANTAPAEVLAALLGVSDAGRLKALEDMRREQPFEDVGELRAAAAQIFGPDVAERVPPQMVVFGSSWFEAAVAVQLDETRKAARFVLYRDPDTADVAVVSRVAEDG